MDREELIMDRNVLDRDPEKVEETENYSVDTEGFVSDGNEPEGFDPDNSEPETPAAPEQPKIKKKRKDPIPFGLIFRYFITALAAANLVLLFVFSGSKPS